MEANCASAFQVKVLAFGFPALPSRPPMALPPSLPFHFPSLPPFSSIPDLKKKFQCAFCTCEAGGNVFPHVWVDVTQDGV